jgi:hypothetical protein
VRCEVGAQQRGRLRGKRDTTAAPLRLRGEVRELRVDAGNGAVDPQRAGLNIADLLARQVRPLAVRPRPLRAPAHNTATAARRKGGDLSRAHSATRRVRVLGRGRHGSPEPAGLPGAAVAAGRGLAGGGPPIEFLCGADDFVSELSQ